MSSYSFLPEPVPPVDEALRIELIQGEVVIIGPGRVAFSMTREAAAATCRRLIEVLAEGEDD